MQAPVWIVDDDEAYRELVVLALETHCGVPGVRGFGNGSEMLRALATSGPEPRPELLLLDLHMPGLDAPAILRRLREQRAHVPVAVLSAAATARERAECLQQGAFACVEKPARSDDLVELLRRLTASCGNALRVIVVDDHELVRSGLRALLSIVDGVEVVGEARHGLELMQLLQTTPVDIVMCDLTMPGMDGLEVIAELRERHPHVRSIIVSMDDSPEVVRRALAQGASGYIGKQAATAELAAAIRSVSTGGRYVSPALARKLLQPPAPDAPDQALTERQVQILTLIAHGRSAREIGEQLGLSPKTVDVHRSRIMERLGLHDIAGLTRYALKHRLVR